MKNNKNKITLDYGTAHLRDDGILTFIPTPETKTYTVPQLQEMLAIFKKLTNGKPCPYYSDNTHLTENLSSEAKIFMKNNFHKFATAFAMKENSAILRFMTHSFLYLNKPNIPVKMFKTKEDAFEWLKNLK